jgi:S-DNA-T family DNA segregation ATPase FtsK/SpoIIIE
MSMPAIERVIPLVGQLPAAIRESLARRLRELTGLGLLALSGGVAAALMTWSVQDPSLSHATSRAIRNIAGYPGAIGADLLMQILGLGAIMLILPVAIWGWRMLTHRTFDREALRISCWILCTVISAGFASCWAHGGAWPLPTGLGGVVGDALVRAPAVVFGPPGFVYCLVLGIILGAAMIATFLIASGMGSRPQDEESTAIEDDDAPFVEEEDDAGSVSLGWMFHAAMQRHGSDGCCLWLTAGWWRVRRRRARPRLSARNQISARVPHRPLLRRPTKISLKKNRKGTARTFRPRARHARRPHRARPSANHPTGLNYPRCPC